jgi:hypothetical protein
MNGIWANQVFLALYPRILYGGPIYEVRWANFT